MKAKKDNTKKYAVGGFIQAGLGAAQAIYGASQIPRANAEFAAAQAAAPSLETPAQFYENYRNAYDAEIARMESESIDRNIGTSVQALQGAGGRALVGGLSAVTGQAQNERNRMLSQERAMRLQAGQELARAEERSVAMRERRSQAQMDRASQAYQAALGNIGAGLGSMATGLTEGLASLKDKEGGSEKPGGMIERLRARYGGFDGESQDLKTVDVPSLKIDTPEVDFAKNYMSRFERPSALAAGSLGEAFQEPKPEPKTYDFATERDKFISGAPRGRFDELLGRSTNPDAPTFVPTIDQNGYQATPENEAIIKRYRDKLMLQRGYTNYDYKKSQEITFTPEENKIISAYEKGRPKRNGYPVFEQGGMKTKGAFDHDTNPIDLVQNGKKVGEATGGEYILNPEQAKAVAKESSYARKLFKRFEKNAKKNK